MARCYPNSFLEKQENENYTNYFDRLYEIFKNEILNKLTINGLPVHVREFPPEGLPREEAFYHLTCRDYTKGKTYRQPDYNRSKRIKFIKSIIENASNCPDCSLDKLCNGILIWKKPWKKTHRYYLFLQEKDFIVVLEKRPKFYLLITSFYVDFHKREHYLQEYDQFKCDIE